MAIALSGGSTANTSTISASPTGARTVTVPDVSFTMAGIDTPQTFSGGQRGAVTTLTDGATITPDLSLSNNFTVTLGGNRTLANPTNAVAGQSGSIFIVQDATGGRTLSWGANWDWAAGSAPTLSTGANAVDRVDYIVRSSSAIQAVFTGNYS